MFRRLRLHKDALWYRVNDEIRVYDDPDFVTPRFREAVDVGEEKAVAALAMSHNPSDACRWFEECEEAHIPGDCPLCGAD